MPMQAITFDNVGFSYPARNGEPPVEVLKNVSFTIEKGKFVALVGANGSGKSTLARLTDCLLTPTSGKVSVFGMDTSDKTHSFDIRKKAGMVFQNPDNQQVASIVEDDVAFGPENIGMPREKICAMVDYALKVTDMEKFRKVEAARLSGGQKQRVAIAGALALEPEILVLDEATSMLDPKGRAEVGAVVKQLNKEKGLTVISITHYMDEAVDADEIIVLSGGEILAKGEPREIFKDTDLLRRAGLEPPRAAILAERLKAAGVPVKSGILTKEELADNLCELLQKS